VLQDLLRLGILLVEAQVLRSSPYEQSWIDPQAHEQATGDLGPVLRMSHQLLLVRERERRSQVGERPLENFVLSDTRPHMLMRIQVPRDNEASRTA